MRCPNQSAPILMSVWNAILRLTPPQVLNSCFLSRLQAMHLQLCAVMQAAIVSRSNRRAAQLPQVWLVKSEQPASIDVSSDGMRSRCFAHAALIARRT